MADRNDLLKKLGLQGDSLSRKKDTSGVMPLNDMTGTSYLRQSSNLIHDALKNGLDVLQMANGDIVTTGTQIVVTRYVWDHAKGKLVKTKSSAQSEKPAKKTARSADSSRRKEREPEDA